MSTGGIISPAVLHHHRLVLSKLGEICFISAETLILILGHPNKIEGKMEAMIQLLVQPTWRPVRLQPWANNAEDAITSSSSLMGSASPRGGKHEEPKKCEKNTVLQKNQILISFLRGDIHFQRNKGRILISLSELLTCRIAPFEIKHFYFLPTKNEYKRLSLHILNGAIGKNHPVEYTYFVGPRMSQIDYCIVSPTCFLYQKKWRLYPNLKVIITQWH